MRGGVLAGLDERMAEPAENAPVAVLDRRRRRGSALIRYHYVPVVAVAGLAGVGLLGPADLADAARVLWRPLLAIASIMVTAAAANRLGVMRRVAAGLFPLARGSRHRLFVVVFALSGVTATVLNNDAAVLLVVPIVLTLVRGLFPDDPELLVPYSLAVFMAAGVAPLVVSNPMNMIVAEYVGLDFNSYALRMVPISLAGSAVTLLLLRQVFRRQLQGPPATTSAPEPWPWTRPELQGLVLLLVVFGAYPLISYAGGPVYAVAVAGALAAIVLCRRHGVGQPWTVVREDIAWEILVFLAGVSVLAVGLRDLGLGQHLATAYGDTGTFGIGAISAAGSAVFNNHPMSLLNMLALDSGRHDGLDPVLAALIGGDLGPRLLPWGSLAGLLWFASLRQLGVSVPVKRFVVVGATLTAFALPLSLLLLTVLP